MRLATLGYTDRAISDQLGISKATIGTYWNRLRLKVGPFNRTELVATVLRNDFDQELTQVKIDAALRDPGPTAYSDSPEDPNPHANVLLIDASGTVTGASPTASALFGLSLSGIMGCNIRTLVPSLLGVIQTELLRAQIRGQTLDNDSQNAALIGHKFNGTTFPVSAIVWPIATPDGWLVLCGLRNMDLASAGEICPHRIS